MSYCLNPVCPQPQNPDAHCFCQSCGWRLRLSNRYEAVRPLGDGINSSTFWGRDRSTLVTPQCLIKCFVPAGANRLAKATAAESWRQAIARLANASYHPQIPNFLGYFEREDAQFVIQDFLVAPHLDQWIEAKSGPFDSHEVIDFLQDVLPILHHLHSHQIIHRDIKPSNFRRALGQPHWWLVDLGASKPLTTTPTPQPGTVIGSAEYAAPEQLRGHAIFASDLYSLGLICLRLLTGLRPFDLFDTADGCWRWHSIVPDVLPSLAALIDHLIQPRLEDRMATVETAMAHLDITPVGQSSSIKVASQSTQSWPIDQKVDLGIQPLAIAVLCQHNRLLVLTTSGKLQVRSLQKPAHCFYTHVIDPCDPSTILCTHPQAPFFVVGDRLGKLGLWELRQANAQLHLLPQVTSGITQLQFTPDGSTLIIANDQGEIFCLDWSTRTVRHHWQAHTKTITSLAISREGALLASGDAQGHVKLWHLPTAEYLKTLSRHRGAVTALCWLAGEQSLVSAGWDASLYWRCPETGSLQQSVTAQNFLLPIRQLLAHPTQPHAIAGSQEGKLLYWALNADSQGRLNVTQPVAMTIIGSNSILGLICCQDSPTGALTLFAINQTGHLSMKHLSE
ncbi:MAG: serine/threonine-protein kinase [Cyanobacteria bacterium P01_H01_bin.58]